MISFTHATDNTVSSTCSLQVISTWVFLSGLVPIIDIVQESIVINIRNNYTFEVPTSDRSQRGSSALTLLQYSQSQVSLIRTRAKILSHSSMYRQSGVQLTQPVSSTLALHLTRYLAISM